MSPLLSSIIEICKIDFHCTILEPFFLLLLLLFSGYAFPLVSHLARTGDKIGLNFSIFLIIEMAVNGERNRTNTVRYSVSSLIKIIQEQDDEKGDVLAASKLR